MLHFCEQTIMEYDVDFKEKTSKLYQDATSVLAHAEIFWKRNFLLLYISLFRERVRFFSLLFFSLDLKIQRDI